MQKAVFDQETRNKETRTLTFRNLVVELEMGFRRRKRNKAVPITPSIIVITKKQSRGFYVR